MQPTDSTTGPCPVCGEVRWVYAVRANGALYDACSGCTLLRRRRPEGAAVAVISPDAETQRGRAESYWRALSRGLACAPHAARVLLATPQPGLMLEAGRGLGFTQIDVDAGDEPLPAERYGAALVVLALGRAGDPFAFLERIRRALGPGGSLVVVTPLVDSWPARFLNKTWTGFRPENRFHFSCENLQLILWKAGFTRVAVERDQPHYTLEHIHRRSKTSPSTSLTRVLASALGLVPPGARQRLRVRAPSSCAIVSAFAAAAPSRSRPLLSIVMPVYNERDTFLECFRRVRSKEVPGLDREIVIVESNSSDGTREAVEEIASDPLVRVVWQDTARGKGNAVRAGLAAARGDILLIQDADLEYDVDDYDALLRPILGNSRAFVLGSRHTGSWKMRSFSDQVLLSSFFNLGHVVFLGAFNAALGQSLRDPFTMFKVFRRDCLYGLEFECDRFDFDFELVIKLLRKGYGAHEIPVCYTSRSFAEGKKVSALRDPITWVRALVKYRLSPMGPASPATPANGLGPQARSSVAAGATPSGEEVRPCAS